VIKSNVYRQVLDQVRGRLMPRIANHVLDRVRGRAWHKVMEPTGAQVLGALGSVRDALKEDARHG
jgi:hypothetical protein